ncbi:hypothetical protein B0H10DRAFT_1942667 [Mycena sp. CBHHK59/15]|nr:hypothetical protein B0H10DRAFT_1942667 [Mycena sp. CBHHK59/15]
MCWEEETKRDTKERANAARAAVKAPASAKNTKSGSLCTTCNGRHRTDDCWAKGGAIEGRRDEVLEWRAARHKDKESKQPSSTPKPAGKPRFAMKDASGKTVYFMMADDDADSAASVITEVTPNSELEELYSAYHTRCDSNGSDLSMFADMDAHTALVTTSDCDPFAADTGATVHISPVKEDFHTLQPISPQRIWGVGGMYIEATAKGDIHIHRNSGCTFILHDALARRQPGLLCLVC